jgi:outer membrane protein TolC
VVRGGARLRSRATAFGGTLLIASCRMLGPDYEEPDVHWLATWQPDLYGEVQVDPNSARVDLAFWWQLFDDPALNQLIEAARHESPTLRIAGLRILESRALLGIAQSNLYPHVLADRMLPNNRAEGRLSTANGARTP